MGNEAFINNLIDSCCNALVGEGYTAFRKHKVDWPLGGGFHAWVGLNRGAYRGHVVIEPSVGIHCVQIERRWTSLSTFRPSVKYNRGVASYAVPLRSMCPDEPAFVFPHAANVQPEAKRLAKLYASVGLPYCKAIATLPALLPLFQTRCEGLGAYPERVATTLLLMERRDDAIEFVSSFRTQNEAYFGQFADAFLAEIGTV